jgi:hypothetical protein
MATPSPIIGNLTYTLHHPLEVHIRKKKYTREKGAVLGWVVAAPLVPLFDQIFTRTVEITM